MSEMQIGSDASGVEETQQRHIITLQELGIDNVFAENSQVLIRRSLQQRFNKESVILGEYEFAVPDEVMGFVRMVSDNEYNTIMHPSEVAYPAAEYMLVPFGESADVVPDRMKHILVKPEANYSHIVFIPKAEIVKFKPTMYFHNNFKPKLSPAVTVRANENRADWRWKNIRALDWTETFRAENAG